MMGDEAGNYSWGEKRNEKKRKNTKNKNPEYSTARTESKA